MTKPSAARDKHRESIIQSAGARRVRRPGTKRQLGIVVFVFIVVAIAVAAAFILVKPRNEVFTLRDYTTAVVEVRTIRDELQLGGTVRVRTEAMVRAPSAGVLQSLLVDVGAWVTPGQLVAVLDAEQLRVTLENLRKNLVQSTRAFEGLLLAREQAILLSSRAGETLEAALEDAIADLENARALHETGTITSSALRDAEDLGESARGALEDHDEDSSIAARFHELDKLDAEDTITNIRESIALVEEQIKETDIVSPIDGQVVWTVDTVTTVGEEVAENAPIMRVADTRDPFVETSIEDQYVADIEVGQPALITISGDDFTGTIERIGLLAQTPDAGGAPTVGLYLSVEVEDLEVIPGSTALAELTVGVVPDALVLPRGPYLSTGNRLYLYRVDGSTGVRIQATFGAVTERYVEIVAGVEAGDEIIISSYQNYIDFETVELGDRGGEND